MTDDRKTSAAKDVHFDSYAENALSTYGELTQSFNESARQAKASLDAGSSQSEAQVPSARAGHAPRPTNDLRPPPEMARSQDRETFQQRQAEEHRSASLKDGYAKAALDRYESALETGHDGPERSNDPGHGLSR